MILVHYFFFAFHKQNQRIAMKTKAKSKIKNAAARRRATRGRKGSGPRESVENRDLNEDEQNQITNVDKDDDLADQGNPSYTGFSVEEEEEREKRRKVEDRRPEEPMK